MHTSIKIKADPLSGRYEVMKNPNRARQNLYLKLALSIHKVEFKFNCSMYVESESKPE